MLKAACRQGRLWQGMGFDEVHLAVPLPLRRQLSWSGLAQRLGDCIRAAGLEPSRIEIELAEETLLSEPAAGLQALRDSGVRVALDGYGRGPTSLRCLQLGVLDTLKLAREWHQRPPAGEAGAGHDDLRIADRDHSAVIAAVVALARDLGLRIVAEAVESPPQVAFLRQCGCTAVQGLMSDTPLPAEACTGWLRMAIARHRARASLRPKRPQSVAVGPSKAAVS
jgi:EAL domain-containing protein (putative c-di-GMP-specific phosphodiesterase class I)